jgi:sodium/potassium-transporting ATPase subunit alpha
MQIGNVFACRTRTESVFKSGMFSNRLVLWGILAELLLCLWIIYTPWGNRIFSTAPVGVDVWLLLLPFTIILFLAEELRKYSRRKRLAVGA